jgi:16S rRNA (cytidine1402-2'-O)-methyltransferase
MAALYVVATPLGNLGDLSARAIEVLRTVPIVAAEDTRRTRGLLEHLGAHPQLRSFHAHSPERRLEMFLEILADGRDVALVSDAGTPGVSDPGTDLVRAAREAGHAVVPIPGPCAVATVLSASGLPADRFLFLGFVPRRGADRARLLARAAAEEWSVVFYEAPGRVVELLEDLMALAGPERRVTVGRELTKLHEEIRHGSLEALVQHFSATEPRGEFTVVLEGTGMPPVVVDRTEEATSSARQLLAGGITRREASQRIAAEYGLSRNDAYRLVMSLS